MVTHQGNDAREEKVLAHELRVPLASIRLLTEVLINRYEHDPGVQRLGVQIQDITTLLADTLEALGRSDIDEQRPTCWTRCEMSHLASAAAGVVRPLVNSRRVHLLEPQGKTVYLNADPGAIRRLVVTLLTNAVKHVTDGAIGMTIEHVRRRRRWCILSVIDTGCGMDERALKAVVDLPPVRELPQLTEWRVGMGIGLRIARSTAAMHGGFLDIRSEPGVGTTVRAFLRADLEAPIQTDHPRPIRIRRSGTP